MDFYYNEVLEELYNDFYHTFKTYDLFKESVFKERDSRFKYKTMIEDINNYLSFEKSDNSNSSKRFLDITSRPDKKPNQIKSTDQSVIKRKIKKSEEKQEDIEKELMKQRKLSGECFDNLNLRKGYNNKANWHQRSIDRLEKLKSHLTEYTSNLKNADGFLKDIWQGSFAEQPTHEKNEENVTIQRKQKKKR